MSNIQSTKTTIRQQGIPVHGGNQAIREKVNSSSPKGAAEAGKNILTSLSMRVPSDSHSVVQLLQLPQILQGIKSLSGKTPIWHSAYWN